VLGSTGADIINRQIYNSDGFSILSSPSALPSTSVVNIIWTARLTL
jgi:hypothetical protein